MTVTVSLIENNDYHNHHDTQSSYQDTETYTDLLSKIGSSKAKQERELRKNAYLERNIINNLDNNIDYLKARFKGIGNGNVPSKDTDGSSKDTDTIDGSSKDPVKKTSGSLEVRGTLSSFNNSTRVSRSRSQNDKEVFLEENKYTRFLYNTDKDSDTVSKGSSKGSDVKNVNGGDNVADISNISNQNRPSAPNSANHAFVTNQQNRLKEKIQKDWGNEKDDTEADYHLRRPLTNEEYNTKSSTAKDTGAKTYTKLVKTADKKNNKTIITGVVEQKINEEKFSPSGDSNHINAAFFKADKHGNVANSYDSTKGMMTSSKISQRASELASQGSELKPSQLRAEQRYYQGLNTRTVETDSSTYHHTQTGDVPFTTPTVSSNSTSANLSILEKFQKEWSNSKKIEQESEYKKRRQDLNGGQRFLGGNSFGRGEAKNDRPLLSTSLERKLKLASELPGSPTMSNDSYNNSYSNRGGPGSNRGSNRGGSTSPETNLKSTTVKGDVVKSTTVHGKDRIMQNDNQNMLPYNSGGNAGITFHTSAPYAASSDNIKANKANDRNRALQLDREFAAIEKKLNQVYNKNENRKNEQTVSKDSVATIEKEALEREIFGPARENQDKIRENRDKIILEENERQDIEREALGINKKRGDSSGQNSLHAVKNQNVNGAEQSSHEMSKLRYNLDKILEKTAIVGERLGVQKMDGQMDKGNDWKPQIVDPKRDMIIAQNLDEIDILLETDNINPRRYDSAVDVSDRDLSPTSASIMGGGFKHTDPEILQCESPPHLNQDSPLKSANNSPAKSPGIMIHSVMARYNSNSSNKGNNSQWNSHSNSPFKMKDDLTNLTEFHIHHGALREDLAGSLAGSLQDDIQKMVKREESYSIDALSPHGTTNLPNLYELDGKWRSDSSLDIVVKNGLCTWLNVPGMATTQNRSVEFSKTCTLFVDNEEYSIVRCDYVSQILAGILWSDEDYWHRADLDKRIEEKNLNINNMNINNEDYLRFAEEMGFNVAPEEFGNLSPVYASTNSSSVRNAKNTGRKPGRNPKGRAIRGTAGGKFNEFGIIRNDLNVQLQANRRNLTMTPELKRAIGLNKPGGVLNAMNDLNSRNPYQNSGLNLGTGGAVSSTGNSMGISTNRSMGDSMNTNNSNRFDANSNRFGGSTRSELIRADNIILNTIHKVRRVWGREEKSERLKQDRFDAIIKSGDKRKQVGGLNARLPLRVSLSANNSKSDCVKLYQKNKKVWEKYPALALKDDPHQVRKRREKEEKALLELMGNGNTVLRKIMPSVNASFLNRATFASNQRRSLNSR